ncbi:unnamed protein product [Brassica oleracea]
MIYGEREGDWDLIKHVFLPKKVLLTSRSEDVALLADKKCATFKPGCLTFEDSWDLLQRITFPIQDTAGKFSRTSYLDFFFLF